VFALGEPLVTGRQPRHQYGAVSTLVKGHSVLDRKARFEKVLEVLSGNPGPLAASELAVVLREAGHEIDDETPKKWPQRGIPERWARRIAALPRAINAGLTADWMTEGRGEGPRRMAELAPLRLPVAQAGRKEPGGHQTGDRASSGVAEPMTPSGSIREDGAPERRGGLPAVDAGAVEIAGFDVIARAIARAVERTVRQDELERTRKGREHLAASLAAFAIQLQRGGVSATELFDVAEAIRRGELL